MADRDDARSNVEVVADAVRDGKIPPARARFWMDALDADPAGARSMLAMLAAPSNGSRRGTVRPTAVRNQSSAAPVAGQPVARVETIDEMNARINSDPELQAIAWEMGVRDGIEPPPVVFVTEPKYEPPWDPKPQVVTNADGSTEWIFPEPDFTGSMLDPDSPDCPRSAARLDYEDRLRRQNQGDATAWD